MSGGLSFDPERFAAYKAGLAPRGGDGGDAGPAPAPTFDPDRFAAFKAERQGGGERQAASFDERFGTGPMASTLDTSTPEGGALRARADEALVGKPDASTPFLAALFRGGNAAGLNLPRNAAAGIATALGNGRSFSQNYELSKEQEEAFARQAPKSALAGTVGGIVGGAVVLPAVRAAEGASWVGRGIANFATGAGYGAVAEGLDSKNALKAVEAGAIGGGVGVLAGELLDAGAKVYSSFARRGVPFRGADGSLTEQAAGELRAAGIDPATITPEIEQAFTVKGPSSAAAREAQAAEQGITLSRGQATGDQRALDLEARAMAGRSGNRAQGVAQGFEDRQAGELVAARERFLGMAAGDAPRVGSAQDAFEAVGDRARQIAQAQAERESIAQRGVDDALRAVRGRGGTDAIDGAEAAISGLRDAAGQAKAGYRAAYDEVATYPHQFAPGALDRMGARVRDRLGTDVPIDDVLTPAASRAIADLDNVPGIFGLAPGEGPNLQQVDQLRKRLVSYYRATGQNPTDRRAVGRIMDELDGHLQDAAAAGLLNRPSPRSPELPADGFPGAPGLQAGRSATPAAGGAPGEPVGQPETLMRYLARGGGVPNDAEARAADLHRTYVPGHGTLARNDAPSWDAIRVRLAEEGFLPPGMDGAASARDVADWARNAIHTERTGGQPTVRMVDEGRVGARRAADTVSDQNADHLATVDRQARRMAIDLEGYGLRPQDLDRAALNDAAEHMVLGRHTDAADAYEAALAAREASGTGRGGQPVHEVPFYGPTARATSDALPIGATAPLDAMAKARGLFREYQTAFRSRGPGDVAGQRLQRILERDASPNEVAGMLFGSPGTGRVQSGQIQTLARVREAVGADSDAWRATQQALVARHLGGEGRDLGGRIDYLLNGDGRPLLAFLTGQQQAGLRALKGATRQLENARQGMPEWIADLERTGFDPNAVARSIFGGSGTIGSKPGAVLEAQAARGLLGADSPEWAGLRQAAVHRLIDLDTGGARMVQQLRDFTDGAGKGVASALFSADELNNLRRFAGAVQSTIRPDGTLRPEAGARAEAVKAALERVAHMVALYGGGLKGIALSYGAKVARDQATSRYAAGQARRSFDGGAPRMTLPAPVLPSGELAAASGLYAGQR